MAVPEVDYQGYLWWTCVCVGRGVGVCVRACVCVHVCMCVWVRTWVRAYVCGYLCACVYVYVSDDRRVVEYEVCVYLLIHPLQ